MTDTPLPEDPRFGEMLDELLTQLLDGREPDRETIAADYADVAHRIDEALDLAGSAIGRRSSRRPSLQGYEIVREIGRGGMGTVYLAREKALDREVALKVLPHSIGLSPRSRPRFLAEARALAKVKHENIVGIHGIVDEGEVLAFDMEFVDGPSLQQLLDHLRAHRDATGTPPTLAQVAERLALPLSDLGAGNLTQFFVRLASRIAQALGTVHAAGLVHRDVKPSNILLRKNGQPVLVDFGLVRLANREFSRTGSFAGTPVYSAPEQLRGDADVGPGADVYALGVTIYECIALCTPFAGRTTTDQLRRIECGLSAPLRRAAPGTPRDLDTIVAHAMEVELDNRYADGNALGDDLQRLLDLQPIQARPAGPLRRVGKFVRRNRSPLLAGCLGAALVVAALVPIMDQVEARSRRRDEALDHVHRAQQHLIAIENRHLAGRPPAASRGVPARQQVREPLRTAVAEYERASELDPANAAACLEGDVARVALWLRGLAVAQTAALDAALDGAEFRDLTARLGSCTVRGARTLARGVSRGTAVSDDELETAAPEDRLSLGLLAFLLGDFRGCEQAWRSLPLPLRNQPLVDATLGLIHRADDIPDLAYVLLQQAKRHYPDSTALTLALAEVAVELGDVAEARRWLTALGDDEATSAVRRRLELDLRAATTPDSELAAGYRELALLDPTDPAPRYRLAQLAARRGEHGAAARALDHLIDQWPAFTRLRLDRARLALEQRDLGAYALQVLAVLDLEFGAHRSRGGAADLLEILRIGGLAGLYREGLAAAGAARPGRATIGGELPIRGFVPARLADDFEDLIRLVHDARRESATLCADYEVFEGAAADLFVTLPVLAARLPSLGAPTRVCLQAAPHAAAYVYPLMRSLLMAPFLHFNTRLSTVLVEQVATPPDLPESVIFANVLLRIEDCTGDGIDDLLVGSPSLDPLVHSGGVQLVDGASANVVDTLVGDSEEHIFGYALAAIGDVDGDGRGDWLIGAPSGSSEALHGTVEIWSARTRRPLARIEGDTPSFGVAVAALGDADGDGVRDFAVANSPLLLNTAAQGSAEIRSGKSHEVLHVLRNDVAGVWFGTCLANAGDADGDGVDDLVVGGNYGDAPGLVRLYSSRTGSVLQTWTDPSPTSGFGTTVLGVGDLDGDRRSDIAVAAVRSGADAGPDQVMLFSSASGQQLATLQGARPGVGFGRTLVLYPTPRGELLLAIGAPLDGATATGQVEFWRCDGQKLGDLYGLLTIGRFGSTIATTNDTDGDGLPEVFVGGPRSGGQGRLWRFGSGRFAFFR